MRTPAIVSSLVLAVAAALPAQEAALPKGMRHALVTLTKPADFGGTAPRTTLPRIDASKGLADSFESPVIAAPMPFHEILVSWNLDVPPEVGAAVDLRVATAQGEWSPWLEVGRWGRDDRPSPPPVEFDRGKVDIDYFKSTVTHERAQLRVTGWLPTARAGAATIVVRRLSTCFTQRHVEPAASVSRPSAPRSWPGRLRVPYRSQKAEAKEIAGRICSPTSLSMVLAYRGVVRPTREVVDRALDAPHDIYGNWPKNVQAAWSYGVPGYLTRFSDWEDVSTHITRGQPIIISIAAKRDELTGAPYRSTDGHLLVLCGFDENGDVAVNDPAAKDAAHGEIVYRRAELETVWMARGGTAYVLLPRE